MGATAAARQHYVPDGEMPAGWWSALISVPAVLALACGWVLFALLQRGWYLVILVPALTSLVLGLAVAQVIALAHCRKPFTAATIGALAGLLMYLSSYYFAMIQQGPPGAGLRVDLLPGYIYSRLKADREQKIVPPQAPNQPPPKPNFFGNCLAFTLESVLSMCMAGAAAGLRARRPYLLGQWMAREERRLPAGLFAEFQRAFDGGALGDLVQWLGRDAKGLAQAQIAKHYGSCILEYVRHPRHSPLEFPVYLTFTDDAANWIAALARRHREFRQVLIEPVEVSALAPLFPNLARILSAFPGTPAGPAVASVNESLATDARPSTGREAVIEDVANGGTLRSGRFLLVVNLLGLVPLVTFFGGMVLIAAGAWGWAHGGGAAAGVASIAVGALSFVAGAVQAKQYAGLLEGWYARRRLLSIVALRGDAIVQSNDPAAETVNMTRRENWEKVQLDVRDDMGLLVLDQKRREVRIEGDKRRYRVPLAAIVACEPECFHHPLDKQLRTQYWYVRLAVQAEGQKRNLFFAPLFRDWRPRTNENRRDNAQEFCRRLADLTG